MIRDLLIRLRSLLRRGAVEAELDAELQYELGLFGMHNFIAEQGDHMVGMIVMVRRVFVSNRLALVKPAAVLVAASVILVSLAARAAVDARAEIDMAATHANLAAKATTVNMVHTHLHHVLNCLVGPKGKEFDSQAANPCAKLGNGAIADSADAAQKKALQAAAAKAEDGLKATDLEPSQKIAGQVATALQAIK